MSRNSDLLRKAKMGAITPGELEIVVSDLRGGAGDEYTLIHVLGVAGAMTSVAGPRAYVELVAGRLRTSADPMVLRIALKTLCDWWDKSDEYREDLLSFLRGEARDPDHVVKTLACSIAATVYLRRPDAQLLRVLLGTFEDAESSDNLKAAAYWGIARASGRVQTDLHPLRSPDDDPKRDETLRWVRAVIG